MDNRLKDISEIKRLMQRSSRFISLSGLSGIMAGIYALLGGLLAYPYIASIDGGISTITGSALRTIVLYLFLIVALSIGTAVIITLRKARKSAEPVWTRAHFIFILNFLIPLLTGAIFIVLKFKAQHYGLTAATMLIFYGLALVNTAPYTLGFIKYLGYAQIFLGLIGAAYPGYGYWLWMVGAGVLHIAYGSWMYFIKEKTTFERPDS